MPIPAYRAKQTTNTSGTGTIVLNAAEANARNFSAAFGASARRIHYMIAWQTGYEFGLGDFDGGSPGSLTRATVLASSNAGALVTLPGGTKDVFAVFDPAAREVISISATATLALADLGNAVVFSGSSAATLNLPAVATAPLGAGFLVLNSGTAALTIDPNGAEQLNGESTLVLQPGASSWIFRNAAGWVGANMQHATAEVDVAAAATTNIASTVSSNIRIIPGGTIFSFGSASNGVTRKLRFAGPVELAHNAASLILPGNVNIITGAGDTAEARSLGNGNWVVVNYQPSTKAGMRVLAGAAPGPEQLGFQQITTAPGGTWALPSGGRWAYSVRGFVWGTGVSNFQFTSGTAAGGTAIISAGGVVFEGFAWRIA